MLRADPSVFGPVASRPTVSRPVDKPTSGGKRAPEAIHTDPAQVRENVRQLAGDAAPDSGGSVIVDLYGVLVLAHPDTQDAAATWKRIFGHLPLPEFVDHGRSESGKPAVRLLRPGNAGSNTPSNHVKATTAALAHLPKRLRRGHRTLIRTDSTGSTTSSSPGSPSAAGGCRTPSV